jgi:hypothetical protein
MKLQALDTLVGMDEPMYPDRLQYRSTPARVWVARNDKHPEKACAGCMFKGQKAKVCVQAGEVARRAGHRDCEERDVESDRTFIYVEVECDPRQIDLTEIGRSSANENG